MQAPKPAAPVAGTEPDAIRNLMVNYIPTTIDELQLRQLFEMYGPIETVKIVCDRESRTSKGYGFVKYRFAFSAVHAIQYLNGYPLMNKRLKVAYSNQGEAQKSLVAQPQALDAGYGGHPQGAYPGAMPGAPGEDSQAWAQVNYMQQLAALQMMYPHHHQHHHQHQHQHQQHHQHHQHHQQRHHHHHHHAPQQPQQPQTAPDN